MASDSVTFWLRSPLFDHGLVSIPVRVARESMIVPTDEVALKWQKVRKAVLEYAAGEGKTSWWSHLGWTPREADLCVDVFETLWDIESHFHEKRKVHKALGFSLFLCGQLYVSRGQRRGAPNVAAIWKADDQALTNTEASSKQESAREFALQARSTEWAFRSLFFKTHLPKLMAILCAVRRRYPWEVDDDDDDEVVEVLGPEESLLSLRTDSESLSRRSEFDHVALYTPEDASPRASSDPVDAAVVDSLNLVLGGAKNGKRGDSLSSLVPSEALSSESNLVRWLRAHVTVDESRSPEWQQIDRPPSFLDLLRRDSESNLKSEEMFDRDVRGHPLVVQGAGPRSVVAKFGKRLRSAVIVSGCKSATVYVLAPTHYAHVVGCVDTVVVVGPTTAVLSVDHCQRTRVHAACGRVRVSNCLDVHLAVVSKRNSDRRPILYGDSRGIHFARYNFAYPGFSDQLKTAFGAETSFDYAKTDFAAAPDPAVVNPVSGLDEEGKSDDLVSFESPDEFMVEPLVLQTPWENEEFDPFEPPLPLAPRFADAWKAKRLRFHRLQESMKRAREVLDDPSQFDKVVADSLRAYLASETREGSFIVDLVRGEAST